MSPILHATGVLLALIHQSSPEPEQVYNQASLSLPATTVPVMAAKSSKSSYLCDTLPPARIASASPVPRARSPTPPVPAFEAPIVDNSALQLVTKPVAPPQATVPPPADYIQPPARKLCVRHQRMADEGTNLKLQQVSASSGFCGRVTHATVSSRIWPRVIENVPGMILVSVRGKWGRIFSVRPYGTVAVLARRRSSFRYLHTNQFAGTRCTPSPRTRSRQCCLVEFFLFSPPEASPHPPGPAHDVLLLATFPPL